MVLYLVCLKILLKTANGNLLLGFLNSYFNVQWAPLNVITVNVIQSVNIISFPKTVWQFTVNCYVSLFG